MANDPSDGPLPGAPLVSIGLPVYNGARYLAEALQSILGQTFEDMELIISDNASTDATQDICEAFATRDPRVRYCRNARNLGAGPNYDRCFRLARGKYFKWAAHDDALAPDYLEKTVAALQASPDAVGCAVGIIEIDATGREMRRYRNALPGIGSRSAARRLGAVIRPGHHCEDFFSLFRRDALAKSGLHGNFIGSDRVLLAELALLGPWVQLSDPIFLHREHELRYTRALLPKDRRAALRWQDTQGGPTRFAGFYLVVYCHFCRLVHKHVRGLSARLGCYGELLRWWFADHHFRAVAGDVLGWMSPFLLERARRIKHASFGVSQDRTRRLS
jgi:glycosyltransferase involved in cell wall biosynthesis